MITLVKIRSKYLSRHPCGVYCSYLFIPTLILLSIFNNSSFRKSKIVEESKYNGKSLLKNQEIFNQNFSSIININFAILTDDSKDCDLINSLLGSINTLSLLCSSKESEIDDKHDIIKIEQKNGKYEIKLIEHKYTNLFYDYILDTNRYVDLFYFREDIFILNIILFSFNYNHYYLNF